MKIAFLDCASGISGNMVMGALLDAGLDQAALERELARLNVPGYRLEVESVKRRGLNGTHVEVHVSDTSTHRHLSHIQTIINESGLPHELHPMGSCIEGEWADVMGVVDKCFRELEKDCDRININFKADYRKGEPGRMGRKIKSVEEKL